MAIQDNEGDLSIFGGPAPKKEAKTGRPKKEDSKPKVEVKDAKQKKLEEEQQRWLWENSFVPLGFPSFRR